MTIWFTSDHHFGHANILTYENRPFHNVEEMNEVLIERWNECVEPTDTIYHLGDFALTTKPKTKAVFARLNGTKHLILGNHDVQRSNGWWLDVGFATVQLGWVGDYGPTLIRCCHDPLKIADTMENDEYNSIFLHGHVHGRKRLWQPGSRLVHVGVDAWDYYPVSLEQIKALVDE